MPGKNGDGNDSCVPASQDPPVQQGCSGEVYSKSHDGSLQSIRQDPKEWCLRRCREGRKREGCLPQLSSVLE